MEYRYNKKNSKWYKKIDWIRLIIVSILLGLILFFLFNYLGLGKDVENAIKVSLLITLLIDIELLLADLIEDKNRIFVSENNKLFYIEIHDKKDGKFLYDNEYKQIIKDVKPSDIIHNQKKFEGIDCGEIIDVKKISKRINRIIVKATVKEKQWKPYGKFTISKLEIVEKEYCKKIIISKSYDNFEKLSKIISEKNN